MEGVPAYRALDVCSDHRIMKGILSQDSRQIYENELGSEGAGR